MTCNSNENWIGTLTGRAGYTWERALLYVKAGGAYSDQTYSTKCNEGPFNGLFVFGSKLRQPCGRAFKWIFYRPNWAARMDRRIGL